MRRRAVRTSASANHDSCSYASNAAAARQYDWIAWPDGKAGVVPDVASCGLSGLPSSCAA